MKLAVIKGFAGSAFVAAIACMVLAACSSAANEAPSSSPPRIPAASAPASPEPTDPVVPPPSATDVVEVRIHPGEAFFVIAPDPDVITARGLSRTVAMHEAEPAGVVAEWVVNDQERTIELAKAAAVRDPQNVVGVLWVAEKPGHAKFDVQWATKDSTVDPQWSRSYDVTVTK